MRIKKILTVLITVALAIMVLTVSVSAYFFEVGGKPVTVTLNIDGRIAKAVASTESFSMESIRIKVSGNYLRYDGTIGYTSTSIIGYNTNYQKCSLNLPDDGIAWYGQVVAEFYAVYNNDTGSTSITKLI